MQTNLHNVDQLIKDEAKRNLEKQVLALTQQMAEEKASAQEATAAAAALKAQRKRFSNHMEALYRQIDELQHDNYKLDKSKKKIQAELDDANIQLEEQRRRVVALEMKQKTFDKVMSEIRAVAERFATDRDQAEGDQIKTDQAKSDQAESDQIKTDQANSDQIKTNQAKRDQINTDHAKSDQIKSAKAESDQIDTDQANSDQINTDQAESDLIKTDKANNDQAEIDQTKCNDNEKETRVLSLARKLDVNNSWCSEVECRVDMLLGRGELRKRKMFAEPQRELITAKKKSPQTYKRLKPEETRSETPKSNTEDLDKFRNDTQRWREPFLPTINFGHNDNIKPVNKLNNNTTVTVENQPIPVQNKQIPAQNKQIPAQNKQIPAQNKQIPARNKKKSQKKLQMLKWKALKESRQASPSSRAPKIISTNPKFVLTIKNLLKEMKSLLHKDEKIDEENFLFVLKRNIRHKLRELLKGKDYMGAKDIKNLYRQHRPKEKDKELVEELQRDILAGLYEGAADSDEGTLTEK